MEAGGPPGSLLWEPAKHGTLGGEEVLSFTPLSADSVIWGLGTSCQRSSQAQSDG